MPYGGKPLHPIHPEWGHNFQAMWFGLEVDVDATGGINRDHNHDKLPPVRTVLCVRIMYPVNLYAIIIPRLEV